MGLFLWTLIKAGDNADVFNDELFLFALLKAGDESNVAAATYTSYTCVFLQTNHRGVVYS